MLIEIKHRFSGEVLFSLETESLRFCLQAAVKGGADLRDAYLRGADLRGAYLRGADLRDADLGGASLRDAVHSQLTLWPAGFDPVAAGAVKL